MTKHDQPLAVILVKTPGSPPRLFNRRFDTLQDLRNTLENVTRKAKHVKIVYAGFPNIIDGAVIHAEDRFKRAA